MGLPAELYSADNLGRAWRWLKSNPDAAYKGYFRDLYSVYDIASEELLGKLRDRLRRGVYEPTASCKLFFPKSSGILRPYSLLTVEDQIVYQAALNVVAERLFPRVRHRYQTEVFGHLYAGRTSVWFYRQWKKGYAAFNKAAREAFDGGMRFTASFDLTACYDSLDHGVLRHFLVELGCQPEFTKTLTDWLSVWTATTRGIYHNHGIPQGPLGSGLLSEVVLQHFDENRRWENRVRYLRYVDDIRLFGKSEDSLRRMLVRLDALSKDVGLFPQSSKIGIHEVTDIEQELKSVSHPTEASVRGEVVNQERVRRRLVRLSPGLRIKDPTRFKFVLAHAEPNSKLTARLWRIYENHPDAYGSLARYLMRYTRLPGRAAAEVLREIKEQDLYPAITAAMIEVADGRLAAPDAKAVDRLVKKLWKPGSLQPDVFARAGCWAVRRGLLTLKQTAYACQRPHTWWGRTQVVAALSNQTLGRVALEGIVNHCLRDKSGDVSLAAAGVAWIENLTIERPFKTINPVAGTLLKEVGVLQRLPSGVCGVQLSFERMLGIHVPVKWRTLFGADYAKVERHIVVCRGLMETNVTSWVNGMDSFNDWLLMGLAAHDAGLSGYKAGNVGGFMHSGHLKKHYPATQLMIQSIHEQRWESMLSHAKVKKGGVAVRATRPIRYGYLRKGKALLRRALAELATKV